MAEYAQIVQDCARRRGLRDALRAAVQDLDAHLPQEDVAAALEAVLSDAGARASGDLLTPAQQVDRFFARRERIDGGAVPYVRTGLRQLDKLLGGGMMDEGLYFLAGRPGMGKTALGLSIAEYVAANVGPVAMISMEMSDAQLTARRLAALGKLDSSVVLTEALTDDEYRRAAEAARVIGKTPLYVTAGRAYTPERVASIVRGRKGCRLVVVPLRYGAGVKGKVVEAIYNGSVIVTTSIGAEGIPQAERVMKVADEPEAFAEQVVSLYGDLKACGAMAMETQKYIRDYFSVDAAWDVIKDDFTKE
ncbi:MAG: DnaB-like helicase C-terminal domain-containing protein [Eubacteriales bacterium]|nr:DnaB-like helicase C-terminal domain-containing protein [Eubacteriales bacterium]